MITFNPYFEALGFKGTPTAADVKAAYRKLAATEHPDVKPGNEERFKLLTCAYDEARAMLNRKRGNWGRPSDKAWLRAWNDLGKPDPQPEEPKASRDGRCAHQHKSGEFCGRKAGHSGAHLSESSYAAHKAYSKQHAKERYGSDPDYRERMKAASRASHKKGRERAKAAKEQAGA